MHIEVKHRGEWIDARSIIGDDARAPYRPFLEGYVDRLKEDGYDARIVGDNLTTTKRKGGWHQ